jgi:hypothetical protein
VRFLSALFPDALERRATQGISDGNCPPKREQWTGLSASKSVSIAVYGLKAARQRPPRRLRGRGFTCLLCRRPEAPLELADQALELGYLRRRRSTGAGLSEKFTRRGRSPRMTVKQEGRHLGPSREIRRTRTTRFTARPSGWPLDGRSFRAPAGKVVRSAALTAQRPSRGPLRPGVWDTQAPPFATGAPSPAHGP